MELEKWLKNHDVKKRVMKDLKFYLSEYKKDDDEDCNNYTKSGLYPDIEEADLYKSWTDLQTDFVNRTIEFPKGYIKFDI